MIRISARAGLLSAALLCAPAGAASPPVPAAAFAALPQVSDVVLSPDGQLLAWCDQSAADAKIVVFDLASKTYERTLPVDPAPVGREVEVSSRSEDGNRLVARAQGSSNPPVYYLVDFKTHRADIVGETYPGLDGVQLGTVRSIIYQARDGTPIPAHLTLPPGVSPKDLPLVVLPHGGPAAHDGAA